MIIMIFFQGDSGGPLIHDNKIIGLISSGIPCAQGYPDLFTRVYAHLKFIKSVIGNEETP